MYLPALARDLYKSQKAVEALELILRETAASEQNAVKEELRQARSELTQLKNILEGRKEHSRASFYKPGPRF